MSDLFKQTSEKREYTLPMEKVNMLALELIAPVLLIEFTPMVVIHGISLSAFKELTFGTATIDFVKLFIAITMGVFIHELLHALGWVFFTNHGYKSIRFGVKWQYLTPYCHCKEPLKRNQFYIGAALPLLVLGVMPVVVACFTGSFKLWFFGFFFTVAAGGDIVAMWMLRNVRKEQRVQDHPSEMGFVIVD